jgi:hypothetical protein
MTRDEIINMAREAGVQSSIGIYGSVYRAPLPTNLERFAALVAVLVAAREREELLDLVDSYAKDNADLKDAIRARAEEETK